MGLAAARAAAARAAAAAVSRARARGGGRRDMMIGIVLAVLAIYAANHKTAPASATGGAGRHAPAGITAPAAGGAVTAAGPAACGCTVTTMPGNANEQLADRIAAGPPWDYPPSSVTCLNLLWTYESADTWSTSVTNPTSGAYGIVQALPAGKMASAGRDWQTSAATQITWGLGDVASVYGGACAAWSHELYFNWY